MAQRIGLTGLECASAKWFLRKCLEEFVMNRSGFWRYMPYYKRDDACVWDLSVFLLIVAGLWAHSRRRADRS